jgi:hypothetical protein
MPRRQLLQWSIAAVAAVAALLAMPLIRARLRHANAWRVTTARATTSLARDGTRRQLVGGFLDEGERVEVARGGEARLTHADATVTLSSDTTVLATTPELQVESGTARLEARDARIGGDGTHVTMLEAGAVTVELRPEPRDGISHNNWAAITARQTVTVQAGRARVNTPVAAPVELAAGDRLVAQRDHALLVTRAHPVAPLFDDDAEARALRAPAISAVRKCYDDERRLDAQPAARLVLRLSIVRHDNRGKIEDAERLFDQSTLDAEFIESCIYSALYNLELPPPRESARTVIVPFDFEARPAKRPSYEHEPFIQPKF